MKKKNLYMHIGLGKCGTSTIQQFLYDNREFLEKNNFFYPVIKEAKLIWKGGNASSLGCDYDGYTRISLSYDTVKTRWYQNFEPLIQQSGKDNVVISSEYLAGCKIEQLKALFDLDYNVKVIMYIRPAAEYLLSAYLSSIKFTGYSETFEEFADKTTVPFFKNVKEKCIKIIEIIDKENFIIRPFEKSQWKNESLTEDFLDCLGLDIDSGCVFNGNQNISPSRNKSEIIKLNNLLGLEPSKNDKYVNELIEAGGDNFPKYIDTVPDEIIEKYTKTAMKDINEIFAICGKDKAFINEYPKCYKKEKKNFDNVVISHDEYKILERAIKESVSEKEKLKQEIKKLKQEKETEKLKREKFFASWKERNHKVFKLGFIKIKIRG